MNYEPIEELFKNKKGRRSGIVLLPCLLLKLQDCQQLSNPYFLGINK